MDTHGKMESTSPGLVLDVTVRAPSRSLAAQCRRPWATATPFQISSGMFSGEEESLRIHVHPSPGSAPYLTTPSSARPNTPRRKVCVRLEALPASAGNTTLLERAAAAALQVCQDADHAQRGAVARRCDPSPLIVD